MFARHSRTGTETVLSRQVVERRKRRDEIGVGVQPVWQPDRHQVAYESKPVRGRDAEARSDLRMVRRPPLGDQASHDEIVGAIEQLDVGHARPPLSYATR